jgi:hypothetical protein
VDSPALIVHHRMPLRPVRSSGKGQRWEPAKNEPPKLTTLGLCDVKFEAAALCACGGVGGLLCSQSFDHPWSHRFGQVNVFVLLTTWPAGGRNCRHVIDGLSKGADGIERPKLIQ